MKQNFTVHILIIIIAVIIIIVSCLQFHGSFRSSSTLAFDFLYLQLLTEKPTQSTGKPTARPTGKRTTAAKGNHKNVDHDSNIKF